MFASPPRTQTQLTTVAKVNGHRFEYVWTPRTIHKAIAAVCRNSAERLRRNDDAPDEKSGARHYGFTFVVMRITPLAPREP